jgi:hypothetical protein
MTNKHASGLGKLLSPDLEKLAELLDGRFRDRQRRKFFRATIDHKSVPQSKAPE